MLKFWVRMKRSFPLVSQRNPALQGTPVEIAKTLNVDFKDLLVSTKSKNMSRNTIFISHATPEDNEFSIWIASRLEILGYKTWIDKEAIGRGKVLDYNSKRNQK